MTLPLRLLVAAALAAALPAQGLPCFEQNLGADLNLGDDQVAPNLALGFAFPFAGGTVTSVDVSSNGFLWLASNPSSGCCDGSATAFLADSPRIAPLWADLNPGASGAVRFAALPGRAVVTWDQVVEFGQATPSTTQVQLLQDGRIVLFWAPGVAVTNHNTLIGVTQGNGAQDPGPLDFSAALPFDTGASPTVYEVFAPNALDVAGAAVELTPNGRGGYAIARRNDCRFASFQRFGDGCPVPPTVYELFQQRTIDLSGLAFDFTPSPGGGYDVRACAAGCLDPGYANGTDLGLGDDVVATGVPLGFAFPFTGGQTASIDVSSNGNVYLVPGAIPGHRCCHGDPAAFVGEAASIAVLWQDLNPAAGGAVRTHQPSAGTFVVTWDAVPEYSAAGSANTAQLTLHADGRFRLAYGAVGNQAHACLVGFTPGYGAADPGTVDLSARVPFGTGPGGTPITLVDAFGSRPQLGATFTMIVGNAPRGSLAGLLFYGFASNPGVSLAPLGMPGCRLYVSADVSRAFQVQGTYSQVLEAIPNVSALIGAVLYAQTAIVAPGVNPLGVVTSNAARLEIGT